MAPSTSQFYLLNQGETSELCRDLPAAAGGKGKAGMGFPARNCCVWGEGEAVQALINLWHGTKCPFQVGECDSRRDGAWSNLRWWHMSLPMAQGMG